MEQVIALNNIAEIKTYIFCPNCGYEITVLFKMHIKADIDCPGCQEKKISGFETVRIKEK